MRCRRNVAAGSSSEEPAGREPGTGVAETLAVRPLSGDAVEAGGERRFIISTTGTSTSVTAGARSKRIAGLLQERSPACSLERMHSAVRNPDHAAVEAA